MLDGHILVTTENHSILKVVEASRGRLKEPTWNKSRVIKNSFIWPFILPCSIWAISLAYATVSGYLNIEPMLESNSDGTIECGLERMKIENLLNVIFVKAHVKVLSFGL